ncbi:hypothetical protein CR513_20744, partial [Mucuna pruriens]
MENNYRTSKELATPDMVYQPWCIQYPQLEPAQTYELKSGLIHLLPKFHGLVGEYPHKHLKEFHVGIPEDYIKMKALPFSLDGAAKDWLYLQPVLFNTWGDMQCIFLEKFFSASRTVTIKKEICGIRIMIDAASGGALMDKTPPATRYLISNMASNTQQFGIKGPSQSRMVNEIGAASNLRLENQLFELTSLVRQLVVGQHQPNMAAKVCGICTSVEHPSDLCPTLQETKSDQPENFGAIVWKTTISARTESRALCSSEIRTYTEYASRISKLPTAESAIPSNTFPIEATIENTTSRQFSISGGPDEATCSQQFAVLAINKLQQHAVPSKYECHHPRPQDLANIVSHLQTVGSSKLPSQTIPNSRGNASVVTLRSGKELSQPTLQLLRSTKADFAPNANSQVQQQEKTIPLLFPTRTISARKSKCDEELLKMFRKVEINIPLLDSIKKIPKYAKVLKELYVHKRKKMNGSVEVGGIVSTLTRNEYFTIGVQSLLKKCQDPGIFSVPCTIGECSFANAMLDLGASINCCSTLGILEDALVQVNKLIFPTDFYMLDMEDETSGKEYFQLDSHSEDIDNFAERTDSIDCLGSISEEEADYAESRELYNLSDSVDNINDIADLDFEAKLLEVLDQVFKHENLECSIEAKV